LDGDDETKGPKLRDIRAVGEEIAEGLRLSAHDRGWLIPVRSFHALLMWGAKAKERGTAFKLTKEDVKRLTHSLYATFGESPLSKLKVQGTGPFDEHIAGVAADVYLEWTLDNTEGFFERYDDMRVKLESRRNAAKSRGETA
jgi:hypothetical protein